MYTVYKHTCTHTHTLLRGSTKSLYSPTLPMEEDSNSSWTSSSGRNKQRGHTHPGTLAGNLIGRGAGGSAGVGGEGVGSRLSQEVSSDSEEDSGEHKKKVKVSLSHDTRGLITCWSHDMHVISHDSHKTSI